MSDIIAYPFSIVTATGEVADVLDAVRGSVQGLPQSTLNTLGKSHQRYQTTQIFLLLYKLLLIQKHQPPQLTNKTVVDAALIFKSDKELITI